MIVTVSIIVILISKYKKSNSEEVNSFWSWVYYFIGLFCWVVIMNYESIAWISISVNLDFLQRIRKSFFLLKFFGEKKIFEEPYEQEISVKFLFLFFFSIYFHKNFTNFLLSKFSFHIFLQKEIATNMKNKDKISIL